MSGTTNSTHPTEIIDFWFIETQPMQWWKKDLVFDSKIKERFGEVHKLALDGELSDWNTNPLGVLAHIIVLDQFSRNIYRNTADSFAADTQALKLSISSIMSKMDETLTSDQKAFLYMPLMHSEQISAHYMAHHLFTELGSPNFIKFAKLHRDIIEQYGRYPHRNAILGRESTAKELEFLATEGSSF